MNSSPAASPARYALCFGDISTSNWLQENNLSKLKKDKIEKNNVTFKTHLNSGCNYLHRQLSADT
jgi:hypothetical protein